MKRLNRINSKEFSEFHQKRLDEKKIVAYKKLQEEKKLEEQRKIEKELSETYQRFKYNWRSELATSVEEVVEIKEPKVETILRITKEKSIISDNSVVDNSQNDTIIEKMTSSNLFNFTAEPLGDVDIDTLNGGDSESYYYGGSGTFNFGAQSTPSGSGVGPTGGFSAGSDGYAAFNGTIEGGIGYTQRDYLSSIQDTRFTDTIVVDAIGGDRVNGGYYPASDLFVYWVTFGDNGNVLSDGLMGAVNRSGDSYNTETTRSNGFTKSTFTLPPEARTERTAIWCSEFGAPWTVYNGTTATGLMGDALVGFYGAYYINGLFHNYGTTYPSEGSEDGADGWINGIWVELNRSYYDNPNFGGPTRQLGLEPHYPGPVSGETMYLTYADRVAISNYFANKFSGIIGQNLNPLGWGIRSIGLQRRTPMNVFVPLDSPEATSFMRVAPMMQGLSPLQRQKKLIEMLKAGNEIMLKYLGMTPNEVEFADMGNVPTWNQAAGLPQPGDPDYSHNANYNTVSQAEFDKMYWDKVNAGEMGDNSMRDSLRPSWAAPPEPAKTNNRSSSSSSGPSYMNIQVGDQQYISKDGKVQTDTTRGIKDGEMDGRPIYYDDQGNMRVSQPQPQSDYNPTVYNPEIDGGYTHLDYLYGGPEERARIQNIWNQRNKNASSSTTTSNAPPAQNYQKPTPMFNAKGERTDTGEVVRGMQTTDPVGDLATLGAAAALTKAGLGGVVSQGISGLRAADKIKQAFKPKPSGPTKARYNSTPKPKTKDPRYKIDEPLNPSGRRFDTFGRELDPKTGQVLKNSHQPNGELISEKKRLKSPEELLKSSGYYDGKPAPFGFPMEPPAKMVNGFHADLVTPEGQEKQSNRYNRMDQATAKAMPMTGNPYIDKKVLKARKQPK